MNNLTKQFASILSRNWWVLLLRGLIAIFLGIAIWVQPAMSLAVLVLLFGAYALTDGILGIWIAFAGRKEHEQWWVLLLWGFSGLVVGVLTFINPNITALILLFYIAIWAISTGILEVVAAIRLRKEITGEWMLVLSGLVSILFGVFLMARPLDGALAVLWVIGTFAFILGVTVVILAIKARIFGKQLESSFDRPSNNPVDNRDKK